MKTLILGGNGQLGQALAETAPGSAEITSFDLPELDITQADAVLAICSNVAPDIIVNVAAYTAVDQAEQDIDIATAVNVDGPRNIAAAAAQIDAGLIHISTDFVFDGQALSPYAPDAVTNPLSVYGETKRAGELAVLEESGDSAAIVRTAWLYSKTGGNFVKTMLRLMAERDELSVVADQRGTPTWADSLATVVWGFAARPDLGGVFHWTDGGECTWHDFAVAIQDEALEIGLLERRIPVHAISTDDYPTAAARPRYSVLDCSSTGDALDLTQTPWRANLRQMLKGVND